MLGKSDEAEDLVQDVFLRAWRGLSKLQRPEAVKPGFEDRERQTLSQ